MPKGESEAYRYKRRNRRGENPQELPSTLVNVGKAVRSKERVDAAIKAAETEIGGKKKITDASGRVRNVSVLRELALGYLQQKHLDKSNTRKNQHLKKGEKKLKTDNADRFLRDNCRGRNLREKRFLITHAARMISLYSKMNHRKTMTVQDYKAALEEYQNMIAFNELHGITETGSNGH